MGKRILQGVVLVLAIIISAFVFQVFKYNFFQKEDKPQKYSNDDNVDKASSYQGLAIKLPVDLEKKDVNIPIEVTDRIAKVESYDKTMKDGFSIVVTYIKYKDNVSVNVLEMMDGVINSLLEKNGTKGINRTDADIKFSNATGKRTSVDFASKHEDVRVDMVIANRNKEAWQVMLLYKLKDKTNINTANKIIDSIHLLNQ